MTTLDFDSNTPEWGKESRARGSLDRGSIGRGSADPCSWVQHRLPIYLDGELSLEESRRVGVHLDGCERCQHAKFQEEQLIVSAMSALVAEEPEMSLFQHESLERVAVADEELYLEREESFAAPFAAQNSVGRRRSNRRRSRPLGALNAAAAVLLVGIVWWSLPPNESTYNSSPDRTVARRDATLSPASTREFPTRNVAARNSANSARLSTDPAPPGGVSSTIGSPEQLPVEPSDMPTDPESDLAFGGDSGIASSESESDTEVAWSNIRRGDLDGDGVCNVNDVVISADLLQNPDSLLAANLCPAAGDMDGDGDLDIQDYTQTARIALENRLPGELLPRLTARPTLPCALESICP